MFTRGMFNMINTLSTIFKHYCLWKQVLSFCFGGKRCALPPSPPPAFLFKSNFAHLQYTSLHVMHVYIYMFFHVFRYFLYVCIFFSLYLHIYTQETNIYIIYIYVWTWYIILFTYNIIYTYFFQISWEYVWSQNIFWSLALCIWSYSIKYQ